jgi:hypothetical protein
LAGPVTEMIHSGEPYGPIANALVDGYPSAWGDTAENVPPQGKQ